MGSLKNSSSAKFLHSSEANSLSSSLGSLELAETRSELAFFTFSWRSCMLLTSTSYSLSRALSGSVLGNLNDLFKTLGDLLLAETMEFLLAGDVIAGLATVPESLPVSPLKRGDAKGEAPTNKLYEPSIFFGEV
jgi:hypothetical protein